MFPLIQLLNPELDKADFQALLKDMLPLGYACLGAFEGETLIGICGYWRRVQFWNRRSIQLDNLVIAESHRNQSIGKQMNDWLEALARAEGRQMLELDSYVVNHPSHRFYFREGYVILGYHFTKILEPWKR